MLLYFIIILWKYIFTCIYFLFFQDDCEFEAIAPELTEDDLEKVVDPLLHEYFEHGDTQEVIVRND